VLGEHSLAEFVFLAERDGSHSGSFEPEAKSANAGKEVEDIHLRLRFSETLMPWLAPIR
jgi:hypothetical protein